MKRAVNQVRAVSTALWIHRGRGRRLTTGCHGGILNGITSPNDKAIIKIDRPDLSHGRLDKLQALSHMDPMTPSKQSKCII